MIRPVVALTVALSLASCGTTSAPEPEVRIVERLVPVPVTCVPEIMMVETDFEVSREDVANAPSADEGYRLAAIGFLERDAWINTAVPVLVGCKAVGAPGQ